MGTISDNSSSKQESSFGSPAKPVRTPSPKSSNMGTPKQLPAKDIAEPRNTGKGSKMEATLTPARARGASPSSGSGSGTGTGPGSSTNPGTPSAKVPTLKSTVSPLEQVRRKAAAAVVTTASPAKVGKPAAKKRLSSEDERLLAQILASEQDYIDSPAFYEGEADRKIYDEAPDVPKPDTTWYHPVMDDLSGNDRKRSVKSAQQVILTAAQEKILFHQFNYARHRVWQLQQEVWATATRQPTGEQASDILRWYRLADRIREQIAETNLALVLAMAKRTRMSEVDFADLVSEGNMALLRAVDKFDAGRGYKFSTYACRAILKAFSRQGMKLSKYRQRFPTDFDPKLEKSNFLETKRATFEKDAAEEVKRIVRDNRAELTDVERTVIEHRFGIDSGATEKPMTLEQVGQIIGVTKERVRQIQNKAMEKIRLELEAKFLGNRAAEEAQLAALAAEAAAQNSPSGHSRKSSVDPLSMLN
jgi:RNA polymerase primary sigma factor